MGDYGLKISLPGFDVKTTDKQNLVLDSELNSLKILTVGSVSISVPASTNVITTIAHGLGYAPFAYGWCKMIDADKLWFQDSVDATRLPTHFNNFLLEVDATNIIITNNHDEAGTKTFVAHYIIFIDKAFE